MLEEATHDVKSIQDIHRYYGKLECNTGVERRNIIGQTKMKLLNVMHVKKTLDRDKMFHVYLISHNNQI